MIVNVGRLMRGLKSSAGGSGGLPEITRFTFPSGANYGLPIAQVENVNCAVASGLTPGKNSKIDVTCLAASTLPMATYGGYSFGIPPASGINQSGYILFYDPYFGTAYVWFNKNGGGTDPMAGSYGLEVAISTGDNRFTVSTAVVSALATYGWSASTTDDPTDDAVFVEFQCQAQGDGQFVDVEDFNGGYTGLSTKTDGVSSAYFVTGDGYGFIMGIDGNASTNTGIVDQEIVYLNSSDNPTAVAAALASTMSSSGLGPWSATSSGAVTTFFNLTAGVGVPTDGTVPTNFSFSQAAPEVPAPYFNFTDRDVSGSPIVTCYFFTINGVGSQPSTGATNYYQVDVLSSDTAAQVAVKLRNVLNSNGWTAANPSSGVCRFNYQGSLGATAEIVVGVNMPGFSFSVQTNPTASPYITFGTPTNSYYAWFTISISGNPYYGIDPLVPGRTGINVFGASNGTTAAQVADLFRLAILAGGTGFTAPGTGTASVVVTNTGNGAVPDASASTVPAPFTSGFTITILQQGSP